MSRISISRIGQRVIPRKCPATFLASIILPHHEVAGVHKAEIARCRHQLLRLTRQPTGVTWLAAVVAAAALNCIAAGDAVF